MLISGDMAAERDLNPADHGSAGHVRFPPAWAADPLQTRPGRSEDDKHQSKSRPQDFCFAK